jgi:hypothetical protein
VINSAGKCGITDGDSAIAHGKGALMATGNVRDSFNTPTPEKLKLPGEPPFPNCFHHLWTFGAAVSLPAVDREDGATLQCFV